MKWNTCKTEKKYIGLLSPKKLPKKFNHIYCLFFNQCFYYNSIKVTNPNPQTLFIACLTSWLNFRNTVNQHGGKISAREFPPFHFYGH